MIDQKFKDHANKVITELIENFKKAHFIVSGQDAKYEEVPSDIPDELLFRIEAWFTFGDKPRIGESIVFTIKPESPNKVFYGNSSYIVPSQVPKLIEDIRSRRRYGQSNK